MSNLPVKVPSALRRWAGRLCSLLLTAALSLGAAAPRQPAVPTVVALDGERDAAYVLLAVDPPADRAADFVSHSGYAWADLTALYAVTDTTNLYVYVNLPDYSNTTSNGQYALVIDATGDVANSGGASDPWPHDLTFAYTATQVNTGTVPITTANTVLPDYIVRGKIPSNINAEDTGYAELRTWISSTWAGAGVNWGGIINYDLLGDHVAFAPGKGVEFAIPFADLGLSPSVRLNLQFVTVPHYAFDPENTGAIDSVPSDDQATGWGDDTTQRRLASQLPPPVCAAAATGDSAAVTAGLAHDSTQAGYHNPTGPLAAGASATFALRACAGDLQGAQLLVWRTANPLSAAPTLTLTLTTTVQAGYALWTGSASAPVSGEDQWYQFRLLDGGPAGYYRPAAGGSGPGAWAATLGAPSWSWPTLPGAAIFLPLAVKP